MRTCYLHIGTHKTGTTSIQEALNGNRETLKRHGFLSRGVAFYRRVADIMSFSTPLSPARPVFPTVRC